MAWCAGLGEVPLCGSDACMPFFWADHGTDGLGETMDGGDAMSRTGPLSANAGANTLDTRQSANCQAP
jgi:hypothetical protein